MATAGILTNALVETTTRSTPDVLGYIFEKYVNQKQMGAYYTREDITGYISRNTVIPFLFDAARRECPVAFAPEGGVWRLLQDDPDRYIYPAVGHGLAWAYSPDIDPTRLEQPFSLPGDVAAGIDDVSQRGGWNRPAPPSTPCLPRPGEKSWPAANATGRFGTAGCRRSARCQ